MSKFGFRVFTTAVMVAPVCGMWIGCGGRQGQESRGGGTEHQIGSTRAAAEERLGSVGRQNQSCHWPSGRGTCRSKD